MDTSTGIRAELAELRRRLPELMLSDEQRLRRRLDGVPGTERGTERDTERDTERRTERGTERDTERGSKRGTTRGTERGGQRGDGRPALRAIASEVDAAERRVRARRAAVPAVDYPAELPISQRVEDIAAAIRDHQVVIVAGETGSGKTTQLPKICLQLGRGVRGLIGHTQPRRLAARTVAQRVADELGTELGAVVGYQVRFTATTSENTLVKLMTDGILLAEIQQDRQLRRYDTLIIDEAHERSLNVDFILGYLKQLLPRRPDLKVVITSATIDPERFARHFDGAASPAPIIEVSGRSYPVEMRYRPVADPDDPDTDPDRDQVSAILDAVRELRAEGPGDVLVFLSGEREIRDTADALRALHLPDTEILPLYARLSAAEQHRVFAPHPNTRRIVLATNVAETSLTVPGIRYVIDPGTARISRYSHRRKVQRLPIEPVSRASAIQRAGRCGRTSDGICIRLYTEQDFNARPQFTEPEIMRTNLAAVILQMTALGLGDLAAFPFIDPPDRRTVSAGIQLLQELGALDADKRLTPIGRRLAQLPVDPRLARMVLAAGDTGSVAEAMVIAAALSIQDPRERPVEHRQAADAAHARFADPNSDFLAYLNLWRYLEEQQRHHSSSRFRKLCRTEYLNYLRVREWQDVHGQLRPLARTLGLTVNAAPAEPNAVHQALLAGLLSHIGLLDASQETREYLGARNARFAIFPGSALARKPPRWVMVAELVETSRLWGRVAARIEPEWIEPLAGHLVQRSFSEPRWDARRGAVLASERVTLYGVPIVVGRTVNYGAIDPALSRELFIRHALVEGDWHTGHRFFHRNRELVEEVRALEDRARRRDILADDEVLFDFYDQRVGPDVVSARHFDTWWKRVRQDRPDLLTFDRELLVNPDADAVDERAYPDEWRQDGLRLPLSYAFEPGRADDGVSVQLPLPVLNRVDADRFSWGVPGQRAELVTALLRSLPKALRRNFVPAPDVARAVLGALPEDSDEPLLDALERGLRRLTGVAVPREAWRLDQVPDHLRITFKVVDPDERPVAEGKDLAALQRALRGEVRATLAAAATGIERTGATSWDFGEVPQVIEREASGFVVRSYPALVDEGTTVGVRVLDTPDAQRAAMPAGTRRLVLLNSAQSPWPSPVKALVGGLSNRSKLVLTRNPHGSVTALLDDCIACAADALIAAAGGPAWDADGFARLLDAVRPRLADTVFAVVGTVERVLAEEHAVQTRLAATTGPGLDAALADIRQQLAALVYPGFVAATGLDRLPHLVRYLQAMQRRLAKLAENPRRDADLMHRVHAAEQAYRELPPAARRGDIRWMIEELRVSFFAQSLGTAHPVSEQRIFRAMDELSRP
jgi:ATP-dependent helicase HrpA